jgi:transcriptional regulator with PAS, ATPase and Fis domain
MAAERPMPSDPIQYIRNLLMSDLEETAREKIKEWKLKIEIQNGEIVDVSSSTEAWLRKFITVDPIMKELKDSVRALAKIQDEVLICGETGTGKELIARALHGNREGKFVAVNCAGLPEQLIESELFGHVQGAFTGASRTKQGLMAVAKEGTLFLDEIGELPMEVQGKLLRALQEKVIRKVGGDTPEDISCRIVCATNKDLLFMLRQETFRVDLYARISTFELHTIPLRFRKNDIPEIIKHIDGGQDFLVALLGCPGNPELDTPYNVRSLQQYVRRFKVLGKLPN